MKLHMDKDWIKKFENEDGEIDEPCFGGGMMCCSPFIYSWMETEQYAHMVDTVKTILDLCLIEYTCDRQHLGDSDDRFIWMMQRAVRHAKRVNKNARTDDPNYSSENQQVTTTC